MADQSVIETGVDKLVSLVAKRNRISTKVAAKEIGVTVANIEEWADFLEEEGIISVESSLTQTYLVERKLSKAEVKTKEKEYDKQQRVFSRKVQIAREELEEDKKAVTNMKDEFSKLRSEIGDDLQKIEDDLKDIEKFRELEEEVKSEERKFETEYKTKLVELQESLEKKEELLAEVLKKAHGQSKKVKIDIAKIEKLDNLERGITAKIEAFATFVDKVSKDIKDNSQQLTVDKKGLAELEETVESLKESIEKDTKMLRRTREEIETKQDKIESLEEKFVTKLKGSGLFTSQRKDSSLKLTKKFKEFFVRSKETTHLMEVIDTDAEAMSLEFTKLAKRAAAFDASKKGTSKEYLSRLEKELRMINKRKEDLKVKFSKLRKTLKSF